MPHHRQHDLRSTRLLRGGTLCSASAAVSRTSPTQTMVLETAILAAVPPSPMSRLIRKSVVRSAAGPRISFDPSTTFSPMALTDQACAPCPPRHSSTRRGRGRSRRSSGLRPTVDAGAGPPRGSIRSGRSCCSWAFPLLNDCRPNSRARRRPVVRGRCRRMA
jgi:hypothetical protein